MSTTHPGLPRVQRDKARAEEGQITPVIPPIGELGLRAKGDNASPSNSIGDAKKCHTQTLYAASQSWEPAFGGSVYCANLDGSNRKTLLVAQGNLTGILYVDIPPPA